MKQPSQNSSMLMMFGQSPGISHRDDKNILTIKLEDFKNLKIQSALGRKLCIEPHTQSIDELINNTADSLMKEIKLIPVDDFEDHLLEKFIQQYKDNYKTATEEKQELEAEKELIMLNPKDRRIPLIENHIKSLDRLRLVIQEAHNLQTDKQLMKKNVNNLQIQLQQMMKLILKTEINFGLALHKLNLERNMSQGELVKALEAQIEELRRVIAAKDSQINEIELGKTYTLDYFADLNEQMNQAKQDFINYLKRIQEKRKQVILPTSQTEKSTSPQPSISSIITNIKKSPLRQPLSVQFKEAQKRIPTQSSEQYETKETLHTEDQRLLTYQSNLTDIPRIQISGPHDDRKQSSQQYLTELSFKREEKSPLSFKRNQKSQFTTEPTQQQTSQSHLTPDRSKSPIVALNIRKEDILSQINPQPSSIQPQLYNTQDNSQHSSTKRSKPESSSRIKQPRLLSGDFFKNLKRQL